MNKKGFTLVELLAVIAILAILVILALPNVIGMFNNAKKDIFLTEAKTVYKEVARKYLTESMKGNSISEISNSNNKLDMHTDLVYNITLNSDGKVNHFQAGNDDYCISGNYSDMNDLTIDKIQEGKCGSVPETSHSFADDDWSTIIDNVKNGNTGDYNVGDTKTIELAGYGTHTLRIANKSTPSECSTSGFSQTACGFVLEFADIIITHKMNDTATNVGGWPATSMRTFVNNDIYNSLPTDLKNGIIDTTVVSGHGKSDSSNFTSTDKLYLLAFKEIYSDFNSSYDTAKDLTRQLDYYKNEGVTTSSYSKAIKMNNSTVSTWWLRSTHSNYSDIFFSVRNYGDWRDITANYTHGVSPAFRLG